MGEERPKLKRLHGRRGDPLQPDWLEVRGTRRAYLLAPAAQPEAPLLIVLHGLGTSARDMDMFSGLARRGPAAGFATVFPDAIGQMWDDGRQRLRRPDPNDFGFMEALVSRLTSVGVANPRELFVAGLSNGALFAERLARCGVLSVTGVVLVAGTTTEPTRLQTPHPRRPAMLLCFEGTADPFMPYAGGPQRHSGVLRRVVAWRAGRRPGDPPREPTAAVEAVLADWVETNALPFPPLVERLPSQGGDPTVTRISWSATGKRPVVLYRIEGGGHGWPGGPQQLPARLIGPVARHLDATGILLETARGQIAQGVTEPT